MPTDQVISPPRPTRMLEFDILRALCALGVLLIHISGYYLGLKEKDPSLAHLFTYAFVNEGVRYALFGFMFISGALLTIRYGGQFRAGKFMRRRVATVLVPYLAWVLLYFAVYAHTHGAALHAQWAHPGLKAHIKLVGYWLLFGTWEHLYFINMLFQMYLLYALAYRPLAWLLATQRRALGLLAALLGFYLLWAVFRTPVLYDGKVHLPRMLQWVAHNPNRIACEWMTPFGLGLVFGAYREEFLTWIRRYRFTLWVVTLGALVATASIFAEPWFRINTMAAMQNYGWLYLGSVRVLPVIIELILLRLVYAFGFTCLVLTAATRALARPCAQQPPLMRGTLSFAAASFGIYLVHPILLEFFRRKGLSAGLYHTSAYLYLLAVTLAAALGSYLFVAGITALGRRTPWLAWLPKTLFGG